VAVRRAGAFAVHLHAHDARGRETMAAAACDAAVAAIRRAAPGLPVGLSTSAEIDPDPFARAAAVRVMFLRPKWEATCTFSSTVMARNGHTIW